MNYHAAEAASERAYQDQLNQLGILFCTCVDGCEDCGGTMFLAPRPDDWEPFGTPESRAKAEWVREQCEARPDCTCGACPFWDLYEAKEAA